MKNKMTKEMINRLNAMAYIDFSMAKAVLNGINATFKTNYGWLNKRVVFYDENNKIRDAYANASKN